VGLICDPNSDCTCQLDPNACTPNETQSCEDQAFAPCAGKKTCNAGGTWSACEQVDATCQGGITAEPATQSLFAWAFSYWGGDPFDAPFVEEDCSRVQECFPHQQLRSPAPWYEGTKAEGATEGWNQELHSGLYIPEPLACINTIISARLSERMNESSVSNNILLLE
jgi:hypothetical protein